MRLHIGRFTGDDRQAELGELLRSTVHAALGVDGHDAASGAEYAEEQADGYGPGTEEDAHRGSGLPHQFGHRLHRRSQLAPTAPTPVEFDGRGRWVDRQDGSDPLAESAGDVGHQRVRGFVRTVRDRSVRSELGATQSAPEQKLPPRPEIRTARSESSVDAPSSASTMASTATPWRAFFCFGRFNSMWRTELSTQISTPGSSTGVLMSLSVLIASPYIESEIPSVRLVSWSTCREESCRRARPESADGLRLMRCRLPCASPRYGEPDAQSVARPVHTRYINIFRGSDRD